MGYLKNFALAGAIAIVGATFFAEPDAQAQEAGESKHVALIAGRRSHGFGAHEHNAGCLLLARALEQGMANFKTTVYRDGWPEDDAALDEVDAIVIYCDGGGGHLVNRRLDRVGQLMDKGIGLVCIHYAVEVPKGETGEAMVVQLDSMRGEFNELKKTLGQIRQTGQDKITGAFSLAGERQQTSTMVSSGIVVAFLGRASSTRGSTAFPASSFSKLSPSRCAALPVGASKSMRSAAPWLSACSCSSKSKRVTVLVLPVPGPPEITAKRCRNARNTPKRC